jgi:hypothetical protein
MSEPWSNSRRAAVVARGAAAGQILRGCGPHNKGLRLRLAAAVKGCRWAGQGSLRDPGGGDNMHAAALGELLGRETDAWEVVAIRRGRRSCVSVVNSNILSPE